MNENEKSNLPSEGNPVPTEESNEQVSGIPEESTLPSLDLEDEKEPKEGFTINWFNLFLGVGLFFMMSDNNLLTEDRTIYLYLAVVVVIHELGHVIAGLSFGCSIQEMQVFFISFLSYIPRKHSEGSSWRNITWSLGVLPLGGVTMFKSRKFDAEFNKDDLQARSSEMEMTTATSPYIEDKAAWQRLLISAAGVLFNIATFLIIYFAMPHMSEESYDFFWPFVSWSLMLALLNILPIYPLDGGSIVFALYEIITGKKPAQWFTRTCGWIGFAFIVLFFWVFPEWLSGILHWVFGLLF